MSPTSISQDKCDIAFVDVEEPAIAIRFLELDFFFSISKKMQSVVT